MGLINTRLVTDTTQTANSIIPVGNVVHKSGCNISATGTAINVGSGYYKVTANLSYTPTAEGVVTNTLYLNGNAIATSLSAGATTNNTLTAVIYSRCCCASNSLSVGVDVAGVVNEMDIVVERI